MTNFKLKKWEGDEEELKIFCSLLSSVYKIEFDINEFIWKHNNNPLGKSIIYFALNSNGDYVAARAFWRIYHPNVVAYQPCDTVTHEDYRRKGLFSLTTKACLKEIQEDSLVLNFPNNSSYPAYLNLGWETYTSLCIDFSFSLSIKKKLTLVTVVEFLNKNFSNVLSTYLKWRFVEKINHQYTFFYDEATLFVKKGHLVASIKIKDRMNENKPFGINKTYNMNTYVKTPFPSITFKANSRIVWLPKDETQLVEYFDLFSPLASMDTF